MTTAAVALPKPRDAEAARRWMILVCCALAALLELIDVSIVNVALTDIQASLGVTLTEVGWVVTAYAIANVIIIPLTAWLGDRFGKKSYFVFSLIGFTASSVLCGMSTSITMLIVARLIQGLCGGGLLAKAQAILFETFPKEQQGMVQGVFGLCVICGPALGPTLGGYIVTNMDWRWIFFINVPIGIAATLMSATFLYPDQKLQKKPIDWLGIALLCIGVGGLQWFLEEGQKEDWFDSRLVTFVFVSCIAGLVFFVWRQLTTEHPVVNLRVLKHRSLAAGCAFGMVLGLSLFGAVFSIPIFAQSMLGFTAAQTGLLLLPGSLGSAVMMPLAGGLSGKVDARILVIAGAAVLIGSMAWLTVLNPQTSEDWLFWPLLLRGLGTVFMFLPLTLAAMSPLPKSDMGAATGIFALTRQLGGSIGVALLATQLTRRSAFHYQVLSEKVAASSTMAQDRVSQMTGMFASRGADTQTATRQAQTLLDMNLHKQAAVLSFADLFWGVSAILIITLPLVFLLGSGKGKSLRPDSH